jgi:hypothetical protein
MAAILAQGGLGRNRKTVARESHWKMCRLFNRYNETQHQGSAIGILSPPLR